MKYTAKNPERQPIGNSMHAFAHANTKNSDLEK